MHEHVYCTLNISKMTLLFLVFIVVVFIECKITLNNEFMIYRINMQNQLLNVFLDRCLSTYLVGFVEASVNFRHL